ncbi:MAG: FAD-dependent oxidoreductase [Planctomycetia bacterium]|nr:FAD-dependent oxidoreductase [Planctomycetia bacterium]
MKKKSLFIIFILFLIQIPFISEGSESKSYEYDVVVYGGTSAGVISAVQAKKLGKTVALVCPDTHLGGLSSGGLGATDSGNRSVVGGLSREFYHRLWRYYQSESAWKFQPMPREKGIPGQGGRGIDNDTQTMWVFEPSVAEQIFDGFIAENEIPVFKNEWLNREEGVVKKGATIHSIQMHSGKVFVGKMFIDASYEGDLMAASGVTYVVGRESNDKYNETLNGIQVGHSIYHQFSGPVDPYVERGNPASGLLPWIEPSLQAEDGQGDDKVQAYCLRMCLTCCEENRKAIEKPENYDELQYELLLRSIEAGQTKFMTFSPMPNFKTDSNNNLAVSTDFIGANYDYPDGSYERRREIYEAHREWQKGLLWTLQHHPRVPEEIRQEHLNWGLAQDEFVDSDGWPHQLYIREARRMVGDFVISERHLRRLDPTPHSIGMGSYNMDSHNTQRYVALDSEGQATVRNEGDVQVNPGGPYPIDFGGILPRKSECDNLLVPVCVSCSHIAFGSIRMEPVFMILGQSAATAAVLAIDQEISPQDLDYQILSEQLVKDGQVLDVETAVPAISSTTLPGIVLDEKKAKSTGIWTSGSVIPQFVETAYIHDENKNKGEKWVLFDFDVPQSGRYECRVSYSTHANRATNVPVSVQTDVDELKSFVNQKEKPPIDNLFVSIGTFQVGEKLKGTVRIGNEGTNGFVIVDAVQILPVDN